MTLGRERSIALAAALLIAGCARGGFDRQPTGDTVARDAAVDRPPPDAPADLARTVRAFAGRAAVRGNVPTMLIKDGTVEDVERSARECIKAAGSGRFLLSPGCGVPRGSPMANIHALVRVARESA